jgi:threonine aldolase
MEMNKTGLNDADDRRAALMQRSDTVVFSGDGEPQTPSSLIDRLQSLLSDGKLQTDYYSLGGSVEALERRVAEELGKEAAIWMPTGTLANHLALRRHSGGKSRVVLQEQSHVYHDEGDALARLSSLSAIALAPGRPYFTVEELQLALKQSIDGRVLNPVGVVSIESPVRRQAGQVVPWDEMRAITDLCREEGVPVHLDGARLYMMSAATGVGIKDYADLFDSVYLSMYKYFGSPFGAVLAGRREFIDGMFHERRMFGSGMSSAYLIAGLALDGIDGFEERYQEAFEKAKSLFAEINSLHGVEIRQFEHGSNIFELRINPETDVEHFVGKLMDDGIVLTWPNSNWPKPLLHVNTTLLRRSNAEITAAFSGAITSL